MQLLYTTSLVHMTEAIMVAENFRTVWQTQALLWKWLLTATYVCKHKIETQELFFFICVPLKTALSDLESFLFLQTELKL